MHNEDPVINNIIAWAEARRDVRAVLLTSSRARAGEPLDAFSDYDVILAVEDIQSYLVDDSWLGDFGELLVLCRDPVETRFGFERFIRVTQYESGLKIDFTVWPVALLKHVAEMPELPDYIDDGYEVILDKDSLTRGMKASSGRAFVPRPPTAAEYRNFVEEFFSNTAYAAKFIRRGDFFPLRSMFSVLRYEKLCHMLEWRVQTEHGWSIKSGRYGKGLQKYCGIEIIDEIENACYGTGTAADWKSLFRIISLFRKIAREVGECLGYPYPEDMDRRVMTYLGKVNSGELP
jgi:aminoglycoside 6-adenylyltransferase